MKNQTNLFIALSISIGLIGLGIFYYLGKRSELECKNVDLKIKAVEVHLEQLKSFPKTILTGKDTILYLPLYSYDTQSKYYTLIPYFYKPTSKGMKTMDFYGLSD